METPPASPLTVEEREAAIRRERAQQIVKHPGYSPQERAAIVAPGGWNERVAHAEKLSDLDESLEKQREKIACEPASDATYKWKSDVSWFEETLVHKEKVRCDITESWYTGHYRASERHGTGRVRFDDGSCYEGDFVNDEYSGQGVETSVAGHRYVGEFKQGKKHGQGILYWTDGRRYEGFWKCDTMSGFGVLKWRLGCQYHGMFDDDDFEGDGVFAWPDGRNLDASFKSGRAVQGVLTEADGSRFHVHYGRDKPGAQVSRASMALGQAATSLICYGTLPEPTLKEPHCGREALAAPRTSGVAQPNYRQGDLGRLVPH